VTGAPHAGAVVGKGAVAIEGVVAADGGAAVPAAVTAYFESLNAEALDRLAELWAPDAELRAVGSRPRTGRDQVMAYFASLFGPWAEHEDRPTRFIVAGDTVVVEIRFSGATRDGKRLSFDAVDVFDLQGDGAIARLTTWYDLAWVRSQL
jgi:ketosteroid isomerase-like protein